MATVSRPPVVETGPKTDGEVMEYLVVETSLLTLLTPSSEGIVEVVSTAAVNEVKSSVRRSLNEVPCMEKNFDKVNVISNYTRKTITQVTT